MTRPKKNTAKKAATKKKTAKKKAGAPVGLRPTVKISERRQMVEELYREGRPTEYIVNACRRRFGTATKRTVDADIHLTRTKWREQAIEIFADDVTSWWIQIALEDRRRAIREGELKLAYTIAKDIAKMAGVNIADLVVEHRAEGTRQLMTWLELMNQEREKKNLPSADFEIVSDE